MKLSKKIKSRLFELFFGSYVEWFGNQITNNGRGFPFVDRVLVQDANFKEIRLTITLYDASYDCGIEINVEKLLASELGLGMPTGFRKADRHPKGSYKWISEFQLTPQTPTTIVLPGEHLEAGCGQLTIGLPFKLGYGGGELNANALVGLGDPKAIDQQDKLWRKHKTIWLSNRPD